jgi:choline dehydrogenase-like flavoprotein
LSSPPTNLTILTEHAVGKIIFDDSKKAIGVQTISGKLFSASREAILSIRAIDSPRILLLSGIGSAMEFSEFSIPVVSDLPAVGKNLQDHPHFTVTLLLKPKSQVESH